MTTTSQAQDSFLYLLGKMIGTLTIEPSKVNHMGVGAPRGTQADTFNELMDAAIAKAHLAMDESRRYADGSVCADSWYRKNALIALIQEEQIAMQEGGEDEFEHHKRARDYFQSKFDELCAND